MSENFVYYLFAIVGSVIGANALPFVAGLFNSGETVYFVSMVLGTVLGGALGLWVIYKIKND